MADDSPTTKPCSVCVEVKARDQFSPDRRSPTGLQPACRACCSAKVRLKYHANPAEHLAKNKVYRAANKDRIRETNRARRAVNAVAIRARKKLDYIKVKDDPAFKARVSALTASRSAEKSAYDRRYRETNAEKLQGKSQAWAAANPDKRKAIMFAYEGRRRAQEAGGATGREIADWTKAQPKVCHWCGVKCAKSFHRDHYVPLARGGPHTIANLVIACPACNFSKNARDPLEFANSKGRLL